MEDFTIKTFNKLIGYLELIISFDSYKNAREEYEEILITIKKWYEYYNKNKNLIIIEPTKINEMYEKLEDLKTEWLFSKELGNESELSDQVVIWIIELMKLRKNS